MGASALLRWHVIFLSTSDEAVKPLNYADLLYVEGVTERRRAARTRVRGTLSPSDPLRGTMKKKIAGIGASLLAVVAGTLVLASNAEADQTFVLVSNKASGDHTVCVQYITDPGNTAGPKYCKNVPSHDKRTWPFTVSPNHAQPVIVSGGGRQFTMGYGTSYPYCFRFSASGKFHPATDGPCTDK